MTSHLRRKLIVITCVAAGLAVVAPQAAATPDRADGYSRPATSAATHDADRDVQRFALKVRPGRNFVALQCVNRASGFELPEGRMTATFKAAGRTSQVRNVRSMPTTLPIPQWVREAASNPNANARVILAFDDDASHVVCRSKRRYGDGAGAGIFRWFKATFF